MWACYFYNFGMKHHFNTKEAAEAYGKRAGFQYIVQYEE